MVACCCVSCRGLSIYSISKLGFDIVLVHDIFIVFFISFRNPGKLESSNLDNLGGSYVPWIPVNRA